MPVLEIFYLIFRSGMHIGSWGIGQEPTLAYIPADTLFAALVDVRSRLTKDVEDWVQLFREKPPFRLTSAFPFAGHVRFYPRPIPAIAGIAPKEWRRVQFVSEQILHRWQHGDIPSSWLPKPEHEPPDDGLTLQKGVFWLSRDEIVKLPEAFRTRKRKKDTDLEPLSPEAIQRKVIWEEVTTPRVTVDRLGNQSEIYHIGRVSFADNCGLWFGVQWQDLSQREHVLEILTALGDAGIGAERSAGYGAFTFTSGETVRWSDPQPGGLMLLLSRYFPQEAETAMVFQVEGAAYELVYVAGYVKADGHPSQRRRGVRLVAEGSLVGSHAQGQLIDIRPQVGAFPHPVWRYGLALGLEACK